jgi:hypothetical protein
VTTSRKGAEYMETRPAQAKWRKSSYSGGSGNCVEVADNLPGVGIRDSKDPRGRALTFTTAAWLMFADQVKCGQPSIGLGTRTPWPPGA